MRRCRTRNEYAAIGSVLRHRFKLTSAEATRIPEDLNDNGRVYRFGPPAAGYTGPRDGEERYLVTPISS